MIESVNLECANFSSYRFNRMSCTETNKCINTNMNKNTHIDTDNHLCSYYKSKFTI